MEFDFRSLKPYVRYSYINTNRGAANVYANPLYAYEHRLFYVLEGNITLSLENFGEYLLTEGDCALFIPSIGYSVLFDEVSSRFVITSFDFDEEGYGEKSRHPDTIENYNKKNIFSLYHPSVFEDVHIIRGAFSLENTLFEICRAISGDGKNKFDFASSLMKAVIIEIARLEEERSALNEKNDVSMRIKNYIDRHFTENISNEEIGNMFGYHPYYINRLFKKTVGMTLRSYILEKRIVMAKNLLVNSTLSSSEIGELCGFLSTAYFCEVFKSRTGVVAGEYRKKYNQK